jgi:hypothetical protein
MIKLIDHEFLVANNAFYQISNRNYADYSFSFGNWQMTYAPVSHEGHAFLDGLFRLHGDNMFRHNFLDQRRGGCPALEDDITGVVSLGDDANERFAVHHDQRSDLILGHFRDGIEYSRIRMNGADFSTLLIEQLLYRSHSIPPAAASVAWRD